MIRLVCFDLDGTLLDTLDGIAAASNEALRTLGLSPWPTEDYRAFIGYGPLALAQHILPVDHIPDLAENWLYLYKKYYLANCIEQAPPFPGVPEALRALRAAGIRLAVLSNKPDELVKKQILFHFHNLFETVHGQREGEPVKPDPTALLCIAKEFGLVPCECAYVGDMPVDIETAHNAGFVPVGVLWGFGSSGLAARTETFFLAQCAQTLLSILFDPQK